MSTLRYQLEDFKEKEASLSNQYIVYLIKSGYNIGQVNDLMTLDETISSKESVK